MSSKKTIEQIKHARTLRKNAAKAVKAKAVAKVSSSVLPVTQITPTPVIASGSVTASKPVSTVFTPKCCHKGRTPLFELRGLTLFAAARADLTSGTYAKPKLFLNCTGYERSTILTAPDSFAQLQRYVSQDIHLTVDWPDGCAPEINPEFWRALPDVCLANGFSELTVYCIGSHGRTGTALAAMLVANGGYSPDAAITIVRERHCTSAVESYSQMDYLDSVGLWTYTAGFLAACPTMTGLKPSNSFRFSGADNFTSTVEPKKDKCLLDGIEYV